MTLRTSVRTGFGATVALYWRLVGRPHFGASLVLGAVMFAGALLEGATIGLAVPLIDALSEQRPPAGGAGRIIESVLGATGLPRQGTAFVFVLLLTAIVLFVMSRSLAVIQGYATASIGQRLRREMKRTLFERVVAAPYAEIIARGRARLLQDIERPSDTIFPAVQRLAVVATNLATAIVLITLMLYLSWWATLSVAVVILASLYGVKALLVRRTMSYAELVYELQREEIRTEVDALDGMKVVKAHGLGDVLVARHFGVLMRESRPVLRVALFSSLPGLWNEVIVAAIVIGLGGVTVLVPEAGIRMSTLFGFLFAMRRLSPAIGAMSAAVVELASIRPTIEAMDEVLRMPGEPSGTREVPPVHVVRFDAVRFTHDSSTTPTLAGLDLELRRGRVTAVVGPTGAGKSTVAHLLAGLYHPDGGRILVDGVDLRELKLATWRRKLGSVPQETFLFNGTLRENLTLWDPELPEADLVWAARVAHVNEFASTLPGGYDTMVGDRGLTLSGGQCQRVAIARAIARRPEVLILDEATSALDNLTERAIYETIEELRHGAAVLIVAHRLSTVRHADEIVVLDHGHVVERGTHGELVARGGLYARLYEGDAPLHEASGEPLRG